MAAVCVEDLCQVRMETTRLFVVVPLLVPEQIEIEIGRQGEPLWQSFSLPSVLHRAECPLSRRGRFAVRFAEMLFAPLSIVRFAEDDSFRIEDGCWLNGQDAISHYNLEKSVAVPMSSPQRLDQLVYVLACPTHESIPRECSKQRMFSPW